MEQVEFPALLLRFNTPYVAFNFFNIKVTWQVLIVVVGVIIALVLANKSKENYYVRFKDLMEVAPLTALVGFVCARLVYVLFRLTPYLEEPIKFVKIDDGGFEVLGGIIGGILIIAKLCKFYDLTKKDVLDYIAPFFALIQVFASVGIMFNIKNYGLLTDDALLRIKGMVYGRTVEMYGLFAYEFILTLIIFIVTRIRQKKRVFQGEIFHLYMLMYGLGRFYIEGLRQDPMLIGGFNAGKLICFAMVIDAIIFLGIGWVRKLNSPKKNLIKK